VRGYHFRPADKRSSGDPVVSIRFDNNVCDQYGNYQETKQWEFGFHQVASSLKNRDTYDTGAYSVASGTKQV
jgi:hypothetical protein